MKQLSKTIVTTVLIAPIRVYQYVISPLTPAACRHLPTCSEYAATALKMHGALAGGKLAANRILRCNPWGTSGFDPVPKFLIKKIDLNKRFNMKKMIKSCDLLKRGVTTLLILMAVFLLGGINSCASGSEENSGKIKVLVSILPHKYFVEKIAGDYVEVMVLIPPGANHHVYDPSPRQMQEISQAEIYFYNGHLSFEHNLLPSFRTNYPNMVLVQITTGIPLLAGDECNHEDHEHHHHDHDGVDPHTWMSARNAAIKAKNIYKVLNELFPEYQEEFTQNFAQLEAELQQLDERIAEILSGLSNRQFLIFHPALGYFAEDYDLVQISIEHDGKEPTPAQLKSVIDQTKTTDIRVVFIQKEFDAANAQIIARELNSKVVQIDPLSEDWHNNMLEIASLIKTSNE
jgi:zinc transport system substrate-binding protein